jgi:hypothetical protein
MPQMSDATLALLIRVAGDVAVSLIHLFKAMGKDDQATALATVLQESDDVWSQIKAKAEAALAGRS